ncbi:MAG: endopeptidase La [Deltaproteobacteria bacterium]|nr:endopeptidase La [Deltaproteobacteria bacterium]
MTDPSEGNIEDFLVIGEERIEVPSILPVLPVRDAVVFPGVSCPLAIGRARSLAALEAAGEGGFLLIATQHNPATEDPGLDELYPMGCIVRVIKIMDTLRGAGKHTVVVGLARTRLGEIVSEEPALSVRFNPMQEVPIDAEHPECEDEWRRVVELAHRVIELRDDLPEEWKSFVSGLPSPGLLADLVASTLPLPPDEKINLLVELDPRIRLARIAEHLEREVTIAEAQEALESDVSMDPVRRERLLRRRLRDIEAEIGETDPAMREVDELREKIEEAKLPEEAAKQADRELRRFTNLPPQAPDRHMIRTYLEWMSDLPWSIASKDAIDLKEAKRILDEDHYGLDKVKERIIEYLAVRKLAPDAKGPILCFVGPPGVGKTSLGRSIARALGRNFTRAALGGMRDEAEVRGHRRTYVGSMPGRVLQNIRRAGTNNPVFLLDEVDKIGSDFRGDPSSALLEVLDPQQNNTFSDHYLEVPFDLSKVLFIATANTLSTIPWALLDRMEVIEIAGYTEQEKLAIGERHLIAKQLEEHGLKPDQIEFSEDVLGTIVGEYTREAGVRNLDRQLAKLSRKAARRLVAGEETPIVIDDAFIRKELGAPPHLPETAERTSIPGTVVGLATTSHGGDILFIEASVMQGGDGVRLRLTGQLGDVMKESAEAALSWVRANADELGIDPKCLQNCEIHIHVPAGATPKDGPSAGLAMTTALTSALTNRRSSESIAMTGEISLRGRTMPVGGIKAKVLAAARAGIKTVLLPKRNEKDLADIPEEVRDGIEIRLVGSILEALSISLQDAA